MISYIYRIENIKNGYTYIGKRTLPAKYTLETDPYTGSGLRLKKAIANNGIAFFKKEIIVSGEFSLETLNSLEKCAIFFERLLSKAEYNLANGGDGGDRSKFIDYKKVGESIKKTIEEQKKSGTWAQRNKKIRETAQKNLKKDPKYYNTKGTTGFKFSEESKKLMSEKAKINNSKHSKESREQAKESLKKTNEIKRQAMLEQRIEAFNKYFVDKTSMKNIEFANKLGFNTLNSLQRFIRQNNL